MTEIKSIITITLSNAIENHIGMEQIGERADHGYSYEELKLIKERLELVDIEVEIHELHNNLDMQVEPAYVLVAKNIINKMLEGSTDIDVYNELVREDIEWDTKYYDVRRKKVLNKNARHNICIDEVGQEPNYEEKKGTIIAWQSLQLLNEIRLNIEGLTGDHNLKAEGNLYLDGKKNGIGFHGDTERRKVIAIRLGKKVSLPIHYQWFHKSKPIGERIIIPLNAGDMYIMSEKAVGTDWKSRNKLTLRHATGAPKYLKIKQSTS